METLTDEIHASWHDFFSHIIHGLQGIESGHSVQSITGMYLRPRALKKYSRSILRALAVHHLECAMLFYALVKHTKRKERNQNITGALKMRTDKFDLRPTIYIAPLHISCVAEVAKYLAGICSQGNRT